MAGMGLFDVKGGSDANSAIQMVVPLFKKVTIQLNNKYFTGKTFVVEVEGNPTTEPYIQSANLNGKDWNSYEFPWKTFTNGGILKIKSSVQPNKDWGVQ